MALLQPVLFRFPRFTCTGISQNYFRFGSRQTKVKSAKKVNIIIKQEWSWRNQLSGFQAILQSYSHQDSMVLAQNQKYRPMEQDRKPRDKSTHLWIPIFDKRDTNIQWGKIASSISGAGKTGQLRVSE